MLCFLIMSNRDRDYSEKRERSFEQSGSERSMLIHEFPRLNPDSAVARIMVHVMRGSTRTEITDRSDQAQRDTYSNFLASWAICKSTYASLDRPLPGVAEDPQREILLAAINETRATQLEHIKNSTSVEPGDGRPLTDERAAALGSFTEELMLFYALEAKKHFRGTHPSARPNR